MAWRDWKVRAGMTVVALTIAGGLPLGRASAQVESPYHADLVDCFFPLVERVPAFVREPAVANPVVAASGDWARLDLPFAPIPLASGLEIACGARTVSRPPGRGIVYRSGETEITLRDGFRLWNAFGSQTAFLFSAFLSICAAVALLTIQTHAKEN